VCYPNSSQRSHHLSSHPTTTDLPPIPNSANPFSAELTEVPGDKYYHLCVTHTSKGGVFIGVLPQQFSEKSSWCHHTVCSAPPRPSRSFARSNQFSGNVQLVSHVVCAMKPLAGIAYFKSIQDSLQRLSMHGPLMLGIFLGCRRICPSLQRNLLVSLGIVVNSRVLRAR